MIEHAHTDQCYKDLWGKEYLPMRPSPKDVNKILKWTHNDIILLSRGFCFYQTGIGSGPSNGFSIYLVAMMDVWGSLFRAHFNDRRHGQYKSNLKDFLLRLKERYPNLYIYSDDEAESLTDELRNNLVHNYGLRILSTGKAEDWPTIDTNVSGPIVNKVPKGQGYRWHVDCWRLKEQMLELIDQWVVDHPELIANEDQQ